MGCNCKNIEKLKKAQLIATKNEKIGVWNRINHIFINSINKSFVVLLLIFLTPIIISVLLFKVLIGKRLILPLPKFMAKHIKKLNENE